MTQLNLASGMLLVTGLATIVATFAQCGPAKTTANAQDPQVSGNQVSGDQVAGDKASRQDPIQPPPDAIRILISGLMLGRIEPCGCASGQLGGLARRMQHIGEQRNYDLLLEGGDIVSGTSELDKQKLFTTSQILFTMKRSYDAVGVGLHDLEMPLDDWSGFLLGGPATATNLVSTADAWPAQPFQEKVIRGKTVRIASLLLPELPEALRGEDSHVTRTDPATAWTDVFEGQADTTMRIAMVHGNDTQIRAIIPKLTPRPDLVIGVDPGYIEPDGAAALVGDVPLVFTGIRGRVVLDARLWRDGDSSRVACETIPLAGSKTIPGGGGDPDVKQVILMHRMNVAESNVLAQMAEQKPTPNGDSYVGTAACTVCHPTAAKVWKASKHAHAWQTLVDAEADPKRYGWPVTKYPDCVGCHVVGYGETSGFKTFEDTPGLADVGCERCHGPGSGHMISGGTKKMGIIGGVLKSELCAQCHDFEQSPDFLYTDRWKLIEHGLEPK